MILLQFFPKYYSIFIAKYASNFLLKFARYFECQKYCTLALECLLLLLIKYLDTSCQINHALLAWKANEPRQEEKSYQYIGCETLYQFARLSIQFEIAKNSSFCN